MYCTHRTIINIIEIERAEVQPHHHTLAHLLQLHLHLHLNNVFQITLYKTENCAFASKSILKYENILYM